jgi:hypothetical protein
MALDPDSPFVAVKAAAPRARVLVPVSSSDDGVYGDEAYADAVAIVGPAGEAMAPGQSLDSEGKPIPTGLSVVGFYDANGFPTSIRLSDGTWTMVADVPTLTVDTETLAYVSTIVTYANGVPAVQGPWVKQ